MLFLQANAAVLVEQQNIQMMLLLWMQRAWLLDRPKFRKNDAVSHWNFTGYMHQTYSKFYFR